MIIVFTLVVGFYIMAHNRKHGSEIGVTLKNK